MGFTPEQVRRLNFKVQAGNVIDADVGNFWYQSRLENSPAVKQERILNQFSTVTSNVPTSLSNLVAMTGAGQPLDGIVQDVYTGTQCRLDRVTPGLDNTWVAYNTYNDPSSGRKDLWINPAGVPDSSGDPSPYYRITLYSGNPSAGGVPISTSVGQGTGNDPEVGWVWNYDQGLLFLANDLVTEISTNSSTYPAGLDFYVRGFRYIGTTGTGAGTTYTLDVPAATTNINLKGSDGTDDAITLTGGTDITITRVSDSELQFDFSGSTGGDIQAGDGIEIITATGSPSTIAVDLSAGCGSFGPNLGFDTSGDLDFLGMHVFDEGTNVGTFPVINFIGAEVLAQANTPNAPCQVDVYIPPPTFQSHFNTTDGVGNGECNCNTTSFDTPRISEPTTEGNPFRTGGGSNALWGGGGANDKHAAYQDASGTGTGQRTFTTVNDVTGFGGNSSLVVNVYDADGTTVLDTHTLSNIQANNPGSVSSSGRITIIVANYATDTTKFKAKPSFEIDFGLILSDNGYSGGRFHVELIHNTDTATDGTGPYKYFGPNGNTLPTSQTYSAELQDVFFDANDLGGHPATPFISSTPLIEENPSAIQSKHLSGVEYYVDGSEFMVDVNNINDLNANTQGRGGTNEWNFRLQSQDFNLPTLQLKAWLTGTGQVGTFVNWTDKWNVGGVNFDYDNWAINNTPWRFRDTTGIYQARVYDPWNNGPQPSSAPDFILIDTYDETGNSSKLAETFIDEEFRLVKGATSYTGWTTTTALSNNVTGNAVTSTGVSTGPFSDICTVGSNIVRADKFFKDSGSSNNSPGGGYNNLTGSLVFYKPDDVGANPNPDYSGFTNTPVYHRLFEVSASNIGRPIASFELGFRGSFPTTGNVYDELVNNNLIVYIRKKQCATTGVNIDAGAIPHSLHNGNMSGANANFNASYANPPTAVDASDGSAQCRTTASAPSLSGGYYVIGGSFGQPTDQCVDGFYIEVHYQNASIRIDDIKCKVNFAAGNPTFEGSSS